MDELIFLRIIAINDHITEGYFMISMYFDLFDDKNDIKKWWTSRGKSKKIMDIPLSKKIMEIKKHFESKFEPT